MTTVIEVSGNNFQLSDDDDLTRELSQASSRKETQDWSAYMIDVFGKKSWSFRIMKERKCESPSGCVCMCLSEWPKFYKIKEITLKF